MTSIEGLAPEAVIRPATSRITAEIPNSAKASPPASAADMS